MSVKSIAAALLAAALSAACSNFPYKIEIRQGNEAALAKRAEIKIGMSADEVRAALGTPQTITFRGERWHYIFRRHTAGELTEDRRLTLVFQDGVLAAVEEEQLVGEPPADSANDESAAADSETDPSADADSANGEVDLDSNESADAAETDKASDESAP